MKPIEVAGTFNLREVAGPGLTRGILFRSAALDDLSDEGRNTLRTFGIHTVIDLRDDSERLASPTGTPWQLAHHPLFDPRTGPPRTGDIGAVYRSLLDERGAALAGALHTLTHTPGPVLVHCAVGKDRTGLIVALALAAADVPDAAILDDYAASGRYVRPHREAHVRRLLGGTELTPDQHARAVELHLDSPRDVMAAALGHVRDRFGSVANYLSAHGFTPRDVVALRVRLRSAPELTALHLTDVHAAPTPLYAHVDGVARVRAVTERMQSSMLRPDVVVVTGDLSHHGDPSVYPALAAAFDDLRTRLGCPVVAVPGNHDDPAAFAAVFGRHRVEHVRGFRVIGLDTTTGSVSRADLDRLAQELCTPAPHGTIVALHHPPVPSPAATMAGRELAAPEELAAVLSGSDVIAILAGHFHHPMSGVFAGIPVWVGGSLAYLQDAGTPADTVVGFDAPAYSIVRCSRNATSALPIPLYDPDVLFRANPTLTTAAS